jgi:hypothetical protein
MLAVEVSAHAIERYAERVKPGLDLQAAECEVLAVIANHAVLIEVAPAWVIPNEVSGKATLWACVGDGIVFALAQPPQNPGGLWYAVTCITRSCVSEQTRERRNAKAAARRFKRKMRRKKEYVPPTARARFV